MHGVLFETHIARIGCGSQDSDVQACWSADHDAHLRTLKLGFARRQRILDERVKQGNLFLQQKGK